MEHSPAAYAGNVPVTAPRGYSVVLPPGWARVPLRTGINEAIAQIVERSFAGRAPQDLAVERRTLHDHLHQVAAAAAANRGLDLYLPVEEIHGYTVAASFIVAELNFSSVQSPDPRMVLARILGRGADARPVTVAGIASARRESTAAADPARGAPAGSRRIEYVLPVPHDLDRWLLASFSTMGQGDPQDEFAGLLVELFDAIMTTFRWTT